MLSPIAGVIVITFRDERAVFDPALLTTFVTVAKARGFTEAGRRLGLRQSTVSQHVRRLEEAASRRLFVRDNHSVALTADGEAMLGLAQGILEANERARPTAAAPLPHSTHLGHSLQVVMRAGSCYNAFRCRPGLLSFDP